MLISKRLSRWQKSKQTPYLRLIYVSIQYWIAKSTEKGTHIMTDQRTSVASGVPANTYSGPILSPISRPGPADAELEPNQKRVLLVAAHPDDPEFSSAGTVANWVRNGIDVV